MTVLRSHLLIYRFPSSIRTIQDEDAIPLSAPARTLRPPLPLASLHRPAPISPCIADGRRAGPVRPCCGAPASACPEEIPPPHPALAPGSSHRRPRSGYTPHRGAKVLACQALSPDTLGRDCVAFSPWKLLAPTTFHLQPLTGAHSVSEVTRQFSAQQDYAVGGVRKG